MVGLFENEARNHSQAVREGRRVVLQVLSQAVKSGEWVGAEPVGDGAQWLRGVLAVARGLEPSRAWPGRRVVGIGREPV